MLSSPSFVFTVPASPTVGSFQVTPTSGVSLQTWFLFLACDGWADGNSTTTLQYTFYYWTNNNAQRVSLGNVVGCGLSAQVPFLPPTSGSNTNVSTVNVSVCAVSSVTALESCSAIQALQISNILSASPSAASVCLSLVVCVVVCSLCSSSL